MAQGEGEKLGEVLGDAVVERDSVGLPEYEGEREGAAERLGTRLAVAPVASEVLTHGEGVEVDVREREEQGEEEGLLVSLREGAPLREEVGEAEAQREAEGVPVAQPLALGESEVRLLPVACEALLAGEAVGDLVPLRVLLAQALLVEVRQGEALPEGDLLPLRVPLTQGLPVEDRQGEALAEELPLAVRGASEGDCVPLGEPLPLGDSEALNVSDARALREAEPHDEGVLLPCEEADGEALWDAEGEAEGEALPEAQGEGDLDAEALAEEQGEADELLLARPWLPVIVALRQSEEVGEGEAQDDVEGERVPKPPGASEALALPEELRHSVGEGQCEALTLAVAQAVLPPLAEKEPLSVAQPLRAPLPVPEVLGEGDEEAHRLGEDEAVRLLVTLALRHSEDEAVVQCEVLKVAL